MPDPTTDNVTLPRLSPEEVRARFRELAPLFLRQQLTGLPKAEAIAILKEQAAKNGIAPADEEAQSLYDVAFPSVPPVDDYDFERELERHINDLEEMEAAEPIQGYFIEGGCLKRKKGKKRDKETVEQLTNFRLKSIRRVIRDDGAERQTSLEIAAVLHGKTFREDLSVEDFQRMQWPIKVMGPGAIMTPRNAPEIHYGLQLLAQHEPDKTIYTHTGWHLVDGRRYYLHAAGAIGAEGVRADIKATLPTSKMSAFVLPDPPTGEVEKAAINASLRMLGVADDLFSLPLYAAIWRAPLGDCSMTVFGATGLFKTATVKLAQQHYGKDFEDERNILHFDNGTANGFRESLFAIKDSLFLIDEFVPTGTTGEQQKTHAMGEQVIRSVANKSGRTRLGKDFKLQDPHGPRALLLSTGEGRPKGHSLAARTIHLSAVEGTVNRERLTECQHDARTGLYALAMAGYLRYVARQEGVGGKRTKRIEELRGHLSSPGRHAKSAQTLADLAVGFEYFLKYGVEVGAITSEKADELWERLWRAFLRLALDQDKIQGTQNPAREVLIRLKSAVEARKIFLLDVGPTAQTEEDQRKGLPPGVMDIGCRETNDEGQDIEWHCNPDELYSAIVRLYREQNATLSWDKATLWERLSQAGYTKTNEEGRSTYRTGGRNRRRVICIPATSFSRIESEGDEAQTSSDADRSIPARPTRGEG